MQITTQHERGITMNWSYEIDNIHQPERSARTDRARMEIAKQNLSESSDAGQSPRSDLRIDA